MNERGLHTLTDDDLLELLADPERVQVKAEELLLGRMEARRLREGTGTAAVCM